MAPPLQKAQTQTIQHFSHPKHPLQQVYIAAVYKCDGCNTTGSGTRYRCHTCDFDLHERCATCPFSLVSPLHPMHPLTLVNQQGEVRSCDHCGNIATGMIYTCKPCDFDVHPLCTQLPSNQQPVPSSGGSLSQFMATLGPQANPQAAAQAHLEAVQARVAAMQAQATAVTQAQAAVTWGPQTNPQAAAQAHLAAVQARVAAIQAQAAAMSQAQAVTMAAAAPIGGSAVGIPPFSYYQSKYQEPLNQYQLQPSGIGGNGGTNNGSSVASAVGKLVVENLVSSIVGIPFGF